METTPASQRGQPSSTKDTKASDETNACAPKARLKTPEAL
jgi:hypothetical protein